MHRQRRKAQQLDKAPDQYGERRRQQWWFMQQCKLVCLHAAPYCNMHRWHSSCVNSHKLNVLAREQQVCLLPPVLLLQVALLLCAT
jgi:hypothetical protein